MSDSWVLLYAYLRHLGLVHLGTYTAQLSVAMILFAGVMIMRGATANATTRILIYALYVALLVGFYVWRITDLIDVLSADDTVGAASTATSQIELGLEVLVMAAIIAAFVIALMLAFVTKWRKHIVATNLGLWIAVLLSELYLTAWAPTWESFLVAFLIAITWTVVALGRQPA